MKLFTVLILCLILLATVPLMSVGAQGSESNQEIKLENKYFKSKESVDNEEIYTYKYQGVEVSGNYQLSEQEVVDKLSEVKEMIMFEKKKKEDEFSTNYVPRETFPGSVVAGPYYKAYDNTTERAAADLIAAWVSTKVPGFLSKSTFVNYLVSKLTNWSSHINDTYVGAWQSKSYSSYYDLYEYHNTIVHFTDSDYDTPKNVSYYVVYRDTK
jgi:hypothetical protein